MAVEIITREDLEKFRLRLLEDMKQLLQQAKPAHKQWLKSWEVKKMLGISPGTLQNLRANGTLPFKKIGGILFYNYDDLVKMLEDPNSPGSSAFGNGKR